MDISVKDVKNDSFYSTLKQIGYDAVDFSFLYADKRDEILLDYFEMAFLSAKALVERNFESWVTQKDGN